MPPHAVRWVKDQAYFLLVLAALLTGFVYLVVSSGHWLRATFVMGCAMVLAAGIRAFVPVARVGLLSVRGRWIDTIAYLVLGVAVLAVDLRLHH